LTKTPGVYEPEFGPVKSRSNTRAAPMPANIADAAAKKLCALIALCLIRSSVMK
jgi:hypothetical protein